MIGQIFAGNSWHEMFGDIKAAMLDHGAKVNTGHWQALKGVPHVETYELAHTEIMLPICDHVETWQRFMSPNLPWAEDHFQERVAGQPLNPGEQYRAWPWYDPNWEAQKGEAKQFSHTYMERFWPKEAGGIEGRRLERVGARAGSNFQTMLPDQNYKEYGPHWGIRFRYGDLNDLLALLAEEPTTRQAYLPIWFPEDLAATREQQRVPCTLGYHLMMREGKLHCFYPMRSVDIFRYLADDIYMAGRLVQEVLFRLQTQHGGRWDEVVPGQITLFASSLHCFEGDLPRLRREVRDHRRDYGSECTCGGQGQHEPWCPAVLVKGSER